MRKEALLIFLIASMALITPIVGDQAHATGYSERLDAYVAGSNGLWMITLGGVNASAFSGVESQSGLTSYSVTAVSTSGATSGVQLFGNDGYGILGLPFLPTEGLFLKVTASDQGTANSVASAFDTYMSADFVLLSSSRNSYTYFSPASFSTVAAPILFRLVPASEGGLASLFSLTQLLATPAPFITLSGQGSASSFTHSISFGGYGTNVVDASGDLQMASLLGLQNATVSSSALASSSVFVVHSLDGLISSGTPATVTNHANNQSGTYTYTALAGTSQPIPLNMTLVQDVPVPLVTRVVDRGSVNQGDVLSVTLTIANRGTKATMENVVVNDNWWQQYPGLFQLSSGNSSFTVSSVGAGQSQVVVYSLKVLSAAQNDIIIPPLVASYEYLAGAQVFRGHATFNSEEVRTNEVGPAIAFTASTDVAIDSPVGTAGHFLLTVTNLGSGPAFNLRSGNSSSPSLGQNGQTWSFNMSVPLTGLTQRNITRTFQVQWTDSTGKNESLSSNEVSAIFSHSSLLIPFVVPTINENASVKALASGTAQLGYTLTNSGTAASSGISAVEAFPSGLSCSSVVQGSGSCASGGLTISSSALTTATPLSSTVAVSLARQDNFVLLPMAVAAQYRSLTLHTYSAGVVLPAGVSVVKTMQQGLFPGMTPSVQVSVSNTGSVAIYGANISYSADPFDTIPSTATGLHSFGQIAPQQNLAFNYNVTVASNYGNQTLSPVGASFIVAGTVENLSFQQGVVDVYRPVSASLTVTPSAPVEGGDFTVQVSIANPSKLDVTNVQTAFALPAGITVTALPSGVALSGKTLTITDQSLPAGGNQTVSITMHEESSLGFTLASSSLTFQYAGLTLQGVAPSQTISVTQDLLTHYEIPIAVGLLATLACILAIRRMTATTAVPAPSR